MTNSNRILFLSHGGGPLPLLGDPDHQDMVQCLKNITTKIKKPSAILIISAHWEQSTVAITSGENPNLIYDYSGFPEQSYNVEYPCSGAPLLAHKVHNALKLAGINSELDEQRGFDHGVFVPLKIMYPEADIPCVQLSLINSLDPTEHIKIGQALKNLSHENLLLVGSGFTFHNMKAFFSSKTSDLKAMNHSFEQWLLQTCTDTNMSETERSNRLLNWQSAPSARYCHPREEHLMPLHICYGAAGRACSEKFEFKIMNIKSSMYLW